MRRAIPLLSHLAATLLLAAGPLLAEEGQLDPEFGAGGIAVVSGFLGSDVPAKVVVDHDSGNIHVVGSNFFVSSLGFRQQLDPSGIASFPESDASTTVISDLHLSSWFGPVEAGISSLNDATLHIGGQAIDFTPPTAFPPALAEQTRYNALGLDYVGPVMAWTHGDWWEICRVRDNGGTWGWDLQFGGSPPCNVLDWDLGGDQFDVLVDVAVDDATAIGRLVLAGHARTGVESGNDNAFALFRLEPDGDTDSGFNGSGGLLFDVDVDDSGRDEARAVAVRRDGWIALAGFSGESETWGRGVVALIPPDGDETQVRSITFPIGIPAVWTDIAFAGGDRIYVGGYIRFNVYWEFAVARLLPDLTPDPTFGDAGLTRFDASGAGHDSGITSLALDALGHPVVAGWVATNGNAAYAVARLQTSLLFADGFSGGTTALWSSVVP